MLTSIDSAYTDQLRIDLDKFLRILEIEIEDLGRHIELLTGAYDDPSPTAVTDRVRQSNLAVLRNEKRGFALLARIIDDIDVGAYETLDQLTDALKHDFEAQLKEAGLARAAYLFAERKIDKVARYIQGGM